MIPETRAQEWVALYLKHIEEITSDVHVKQEEVAPIRVPQYLPWSRILLQIGDSLLLGGGVRTCFLLEGDARFSKNSFAELRDRFLRQQMPREDGDLFFRCVGTFCGGSTDETRASPKAV